MQAVLAAVRKDSRPTFVTVKMASVTAVGVFSEQSLSLLT